MTTRALSASTSSRCDSWLPNGQKLIIHGGGRLVATECSPFKAATGSPINLDDIVASDDLGQEVHAYQRHQ